MKFLVIVESPTKAKTISKFLSDDYIIEASVGHIRDLPQTAKDVPEDMKQIKWARLGIDVENKFQPLYVIPKSKKRIINKISESIKNVDMLLLATDEDREGESICWHLLEVLNPKIPVKRMVFHEITKTAIDEALRTARAVDMQLVKAQETRRFLDRLYGYTLSPLLWKKISFGLSAGRVQSPALRMIVHREYQRMRFKKNTYWDIVATISDPVDFQAKLIRYKEKTIAQSRHFDSITGSYIGSDDIIHIHESLAQKIIKELPKTWEILSNEAKFTTQRPTPPYITSTLQQDAHRKLFLNSRQSMRVAQSLYEAGYITYMRTDSPFLSQEALQAIRKDIKDNFGEEYLPEEPREYRPRSTTSQEAHEAIRPAGAVFRHPLSTSLAGTELKLYTLIYNRTIASQMTNARKRTLRIRIAAADCIFSASATTVEFPGFLAAYGTEKTQSPLIESLEKGETLSPDIVLPDKHDTKPPARYNEASIIEALEERGIGRPSTYANIINTLYERKYVMKKDSAMAPTFVGLVVSELLQDHFPELVTDKFTRDMEESLDFIALGKLDSVEYLSNFFLGDKGLKNWIKQVEPTIEADQARKIEIPLISEEIRVSRYGAYIGSPDDDDEKINFPPDLPPADITKDIVDELARTNNTAPSLLGIHPDTNQNIYYAIGPYGAYLQLGEKTDKSMKRQRVTLEKDEVSVEDAVRLLSLPRKLGKHPEQKKDVFVTIGPYGPYVGCVKEYRPLEEEDDVFELTLERALELLKKPKKRRSRQPKKD